MRPCDAFLPCQPYLLMSQVRGLQNKSCLCWSQRSPKSAVLTVALVASFHSRKRKWKEPDSPIEATLPEEVDPLAPDAGSAATRIFVAHNLNQNLKALRLPSDLAFTVDGATLKNGESLQIQMVYANCGSPVVSLLDATPLQTTEPPLPPKDVASRDTPKEDALLATLLEPDKRARHRPTAPPLLDLHSGARLVDNLLATTEKFGMTLPELQLRFAVFAGDGLLEGPFNTCQPGCGNLLARRLSLEQRSSLCEWGSLDWFHACEKSGAHSDAQEKSKSKNLFQNLPVLHSGAIFCQTEAIENTRRKAKNPSKICGLKTADAKEARQFGRDLLDAPMLIFCSFHYEHRRQNLLAVAAHGQSSAMPNNVKFTLAVEALLAMSEDRVTFAALQNAVVVLEPAGVFPDCRQHGQVGRALLPAVHHAVQWLDGCQTGVETIPAVSQTSD
ncbi:unnamed protein product [Effrenium voratum]|uniref:Uncharacterized protein n=1 Tax=Effrenium voratum TaxID=2562239 RepID=A0AA36INE7_9DINO|nr:unnamed protein product [Effrenium voratum]